ncbi:hypothetical protein ACFL16_02075 [Patescibacteria group bacterium]
MRHVRINGVKLFYKGCTIKVRYRRKGTQVRGTRVVFGRDRCSFDMSEVFNSDRVRNPRVLHPQGFLTIENLKERVGWVIHGVDGVVRYFYRFVGDRISDIDEFSGRINFSQGGRFEIGRDVYAENMIIMCLMVPVGSVASGMRNYEIVDGEISNSSRAKSIKTMIAVDRYDIVEFKYVKP